MNKLVKRYKMTKEELLEQAAAKYAFTFIGILVVATLIAFSGLFIYSIHWQPLPAIKQDGK